MTMAAEVGRTGAPKLVVEVVLLAPGDAGQESRAQAREEGQQPPPREAGQTW